MRVWLFLFLSFTLSLSAVSRAVPIEDFDSGDILLTSFPDEDTDSLAYGLDSLTTYNGSHYSLHLWGDTWKQETITPLTLDSTAVWQVAAYVETASELQGIAFGDGTNLLYYVFAGTQEADPNTWITVYQGAFSIGQWNLYDLPIADDFQARFGYLPTIDRIVYINDQGNGNPGEIWFDHLVNIEDDLPIPPAVSILYETGAMHRQRDGSRDITVQFHGLVTDPDSDSLAYAWDFGDSTTSTEIDPAHTFRVTDDHPHAVRLTVTDDTGCVGWATCRIIVDPGDSSLPFTMNFVGDLMLGRNMVSKIDAIGLDNVFAPTYDIFGGDADISVANLECCFTNATVHHPTKSIWFKGRPGDLVGLVDAGIDIVTEANNHAMDYLEQGLTDTEAGLDSLGILHSGAGINAYQASLPLFYSQSGLSLAFIANCDRTGQYNNAQPFLDAGENKYGFAMLTPYNLDQQLAAVDTLADLKIVEMHAGSEYSLTPGHDYDKSPDDSEVDVLHGDEDFSLLLDVPRMWDIQLRHYAVDHGADLVIVNHPHILQGLELYHGKLIAHSLGNYVFDMGYPETMPSVVLKTTYDGEKFTDYQATPVFLDDFIPQRATGALGMHVLDYLARRSRELGTYLRIDRDNLTAHVLIDTLNLVGYSTLQSMTPTFVAVDDSFETAPLPLARQGSINQLNASPWLQCALGRDLIWWGNMEDEGGTLWDLNSTYETYDTDVYHAGVRSLCLGGYAGASGVLCSLKDRMKCYSDSSRYTIGGWVRTHNVTSAVLNVRFYTARDQGTLLGEVSTSALSGNNNWTYSWADFTPPDGTGYFDVRLKVVSTGDSVGYGWFDDVSLIQWDEAQSCANTLAYAAPNDYYFARFTATEIPEDPSVSYSETNFDTLIPHVDNDDAITQHLAVFNGNYPNPFNPDTNLSFSLKAEARVALQVYNIRGQLVRTLLDERLAPGNHTVVWNGRNQQNRTVASGVYFFRLLANGKNVAVRKGLLLK